MLRFKPTMASFGPNGFLAYYRGQPFEYDRYIPYAQIEIDILSGKAGSWLSANRDKIAGNAKNELHELTLRAVKEYIRQEFSLCLPPEDIRPIYSLFLELMALDDSDFWPELAQKLNHSWRYLKFFGSNFTFREFINGDGGVVTLRPPEGFTVQSGEDFVVEGESIMRLLFDSWLKQAEGSICVVEPEYGLKTSPSGNQNDHAVPHLFEPQRLQWMRYALRYKLEKTAQPPYTTGALAARLASLIHLDFYNRRFLLADHDGRWEALQLRDRTSLAAAPLYINVKPNTKFILLPFLFVTWPNRVEATSEQVDRLAIWTQPHLEQKISLQDIRSKYRDLVKYIDDEVMRTSSYHDEWIKARGVRDENTPN